jgi:hypothetical protein
MKIFIFFIGFVTEQEYYGDNYVEEPRDDWWNDEDVVNAMLEN